jgi:ketosteroid isomerase-like protein
VVASANLELVRSICEARERGDYSSAEWASQEIEYVLADGPEPATWRGKAEMARGIRDFLSAWEGARTEIDGYRQLDAERVLVLLRMSGRGRVSGIDLAQTGAEGADVFHLRDGKVARIVHYFDRRRALAVEVVKLAYDAWNLGGPEVAKHHWAEDFEYHDPSTFPDAQVVRGREAVAAHLSGLRSVGGDLKVVIHELSPISVDEVLLLYELAFEGSASHIAVGARPGNVIQVRNGKLQRVRAFLSWDEARAVADAGTPQEDR